MKVVNCKRFPTFRQKNASIHKNTFFMKKIILLSFLFFSITSFSQNFEKSWTKVIELENEGKIKTANREVEYIYKKATSDKNEVQIIKCFFYKSKYMQSLEEDSQSKIISNLENEISTISIPSKAILNLIYAKCLTSYLEINKYSVYRRTKLDSTTIGNILTWDAPNFENKIKKVYNETLKDEVILKTIPLNKYEQIFDFFDIKKYNNSSLFDYLTQANIDFYLTKVNKFNFFKLNNEINEKSLLGSNNKFKSINFDSIKNENIKKVLQLYQKANYPKESSEMKLDRLTFCSKYILKNDLTLLKSLNDLQKETSDEMLIQKIQYEKAIIYDDLAEKDKFPDYKIKAVFCLDSILSVVNNSNAFKKATTKKHEITLKKLDIQLLQHCYENENTRAFVRYTNIEKFKILFYKINSKFEQKNLQNDSLIKDFISKNKIYKFQEYTLKDNKDYFDYSTEVILPKLEIGSYLVLIEGIEKHNDKNIYRTITVSNSSVLAYHKNNNTTYQILNRKTGKPIENCQVKSIDFNLITNKDGIVQFDESIKKDTNYNYRDIIVINKNDTINLAKNYLNTTYNDYNQENSKIRAKVNFYLDRAIYRPGQTVYYKGIAIQKQNEETKVLPNFLIHIKIVDNNYNEIKSFDVTTNEFGSFSGEFILPKNGITGDYRIEASEPDDYEKDILYDKINDEHPIWDNGEFENSEIEFQVEEYKRPKFEISFNPITDSFIINDKILVKGSAKSFAGSTISYTKVTYAIVRSSYSINKRRYYDDSETLVSSETKTDSSGNFSIDFIALPDEDIKDEKNTIYSYRIKAIITDINGETHSTETAINIGSQSLKLETKIAPKIISNEKNNIYINSTNLNNQFVAIKGELKLYFIKGFEKKFKNRVFEKPEINSISNEDFENLFPFENYEKPINENTPGTLVYSKKIDTKIDKTIPLDFITNYKSGYYKWFFSTNDKFNNPIVSSAFFQLYQVNDKQSTGNDLLTIRQLNENPKKDGYVLVQINSAVPELYISCNGIYSHQNFFEQNIAINNYKTELKIPIEKGIKDLFKIGLETIYENQHFIYDKDIYIKDDLPKINIETETFRDKLEPGKTENWSFKIKDKDPKSELEVLASMYDSSLDQFKKSYWEPLIFRRFNNNHFSGKTPLGFEKTNIQLSNSNSKLASIEFQNEGTKLMWFGFDFNYQNNPFIAKEYRKQITKKARKPASATTIYGLLTDGKLPLPGGFIFVKGTVRGTSSDIDGYYEIEAAPGEVLAFTFQGYITKYVTVGKSKKYDVVLNESAKILDEIIVSGAMGIKKSKDALTSSQQVISFKELTQAANPNVLQTLKGKVSGLVINTITNGLNPTTKITIRGNRTLTGDNEALIVIDGVISTAATLSQMDADTVVDVNIIKGAQGTALYGAQGVNGIVIVTTKKGIQELTQVKTRTIRNEVAFFYPNLRTDKEGKINFSFTSPEELTQWKFRLFAHDKNATIGYLEKFVITQKELMVFPNMPRFLRENDTIVISAKVTNLTTNTKNGNAILQLFDATTMENIDAKMENENAVRSFSITPSGNAIVKWKIIIPQGLHGVQYKVIAKSENYSDGEESILPVLTNNLLVTESIPIWVKENTKKEYIFENLKNNTSSTLRNHQFTFEYTSNPTWIAIQSLPYLMEYEHECAEQTFARFYSNTLATEIINNNPKIQKIFDDWKKIEKPVSKLEQNEELKSLILAETPWMKDAENEEEKKKNLALLFDLENMKTSYENTFKKLKEKQKPSGGFAWFDDGTENEYITRHIVAGLGHLQKLKINKEIVSNFKEITKNAIPFLDAKYLESNKNVKNRNNPYVDLHYLYARSFYLDSYPVSKEVKIAINKELESINSNWLTYSIYSKGMAALILNRFEETKIAKKIIENLKETSSVNENWGMYWIENKSGWNWYQAPIETQALLIEAFSEIDNDTKSVDAMKVWLLKNKQTKNWPTTKSTTEAIYALLLQGTDWLSVKDNTIIKIGDEKIMTKKLSVNEKEAETGYIKMTWKTNEIKSEMATISIENKTKITGFGGVYWQYFEDLDKIKTINGNALSISKELHLKKNTTNGIELQRINSNNPIKLGDLVTVRLIITSKEDMEYVHLKDMRASCFEPTNVLSEYKWINGLGFYMSTKDAATHFFFDKINKGTYVLEYDIRVNNIGDFSNGITTIESMYAPEFSSHTKGTRVNIKE